MEKDNIDRIVSGVMQDREEAQTDLSLRPQNFRQYIGQKRVKENLTLFIKATKKRKEALDHCLFSGPPGLGKTTLAYLVAKELDSELYTVSGPALDKKGDLAALLTNLKAFDVLFIDEIHRIPTAVEEVLYSAMEDYQLDLVLGQGPGARTMRLDLAPFTLVGATTRSGLLTTPLRDRFGISMTLNFYETEELAEIIRQSAKVMHLQMDKKGSEELAKRSRGTPRIANRLLRRVRDFAEVQNQSIIKEDLVKEALERLEVDSRGLDAMDKKILLSIIKRFDGGPVGLDTLASSIGEESQTIEDVYEPFLLQKGFIQRTPRGRIACRTAFEHFAIEQKKQSHFDNLEL